jgi:hypothetical protein
MPTTERIDYAAELERVSAAVMSPSNPGDVVSAFDGLLLAEAALVIRVQARQIERLKPPGAAR